MFVNLFFNGVFIWAGISDWKVSGIWRRHTEKFGVSRASLLEGTLWFPWWGFLKALSCRSSQGSVKTACGLTSLPHFCWETSDYNFLLEESERSDRRAVRESCWCGQGTVLKPEGNIWSLTQPLCVVKAANLTGSNLCCRATISAFVGVKLE